MDSLQKQMNDILDLYSAEITAAMKKSTEEVAEKSVEKLRGTSPERTGKYARSWKEKVAYESTNEVRREVYNDKHYRLTHLLEKGHAKRGGGRVAAIPHIKPVEDWVIKEYEKKVTEAIKNESK